MKFEMIDKKTQRKISEAEVPEIAEEIAKFRSGPGRDFAGTFGLALWTGRLTGRIEGIYRLKWGDISSIHSSIQMDDVISVYFAVGVIERIKRDREGRRNK